jgi:hypothetical protein
MGSAIDIGSALDSPFGLPTGCRLRSPSRPVDCRDRRAGPRPRLPARHRPRPAGRDLAPDLVGALGLTSRCGMPRTPRRGVQGLGVDRPVALSADQPGRYAGRPGGRGDPRRAVCRRVQLDGAAVRRRGRPRGPHRVWRRPAARRTPSRSSTSDCPPTSTSEGRSTTGFTSSGGWPSEVGNPDFGVPDFNLDSDRGYAWHCWDWDRSGVHPAITRHQSGQFRGVEDYGYPKPCTSPQLFHADHDCPAAPNQWYDPERSTSPCTTCPAP